MALRRVFPGVSGAVVTGGPRIGVRAAARRLLENGNREFATLLDPTARPAEPRVIPLDPADLGWGGAAGELPAQAPFAAVLGCADARVPTGSSRCGILPT